jgi:Uma2 family endonuclease
MTQSLRWTSADLELLPDDGKRYEIIDGELYVSRQPHYYHQLICMDLGAPLQRWSRETRAGQVSGAPGVIFADDDDVAPDLAWVSTERLGTVLAPDGKFHAAPDLVVEVLSPGSTNERRDREVKLKLYARRGVREYWIVDWRRRQVEVFRREDSTLGLIATLLEGDTLQSPMLPDFALPLEELFAQIPRE